MTTCQVFGKSMKMLVADLSYTRICILAWMNLISDSQTPNRRPAYTDCRPSHGREQIFVNLYVWQALSQGTECTLIQYAIQIQVEQMWHGLQLPENNKAIKLIILITIMNSFVCLQKKVRYHSGFYSGLLDCLKQWHQMRSSHFIYGVNTRERFLQNFLNTVYFKIQKLTQKQEN